MKGDINNFNEFSLSANEEGASKAIEEGQEEEEEDIGLLEQTTTLPLHNQLFNKELQRQIQEKLQNNEKLINMFQKLDSGKMSPSKSNKVPSSLSFKRRSDDHTLPDPFPQVDSNRLQKRFTLINDKRSKYGEYGLIKGDGLEIEDEQSMIIMSARGANNGKNYEM